MTRAWVASGLGLLFWVALGILVTTWYDRKHLDRMPPDLMAYVDRAVLAYRDETRQNRSRSRRDPGEVSASADDDAPGTSALP